MPIVYEDPAAPQPIQARRERPLTVYATQVKLGVYQAIRYINQEVGFDALRPTFDRSTANIVVRPTPRSILREYTDVLRAYVAGNPGPLDRYIAAGKSTQFISQIPSSAGQARRSQAIIFLNPPYAAPLWARIQGYPPPSPRGPATGLLAKFLRMGESVPDLDRPGPWIVAAHELGHGLGLTHYDPGWSDPMTGEERGTITTGGYGISPDQEAVIRDILGFPADVWGGTSD